MTHHINNTIILDQAFVITYFSWNVNYSQANCSSLRSYPSLLKAHQRIAPGYCIFSLYPIAWSLISVHHFIECQSIYLYCCFTKSSLKSPNSKPFQQKCFFHLRILKTNLLSRMATFLPSFLLIRVQKSVPTGMSRFESSHVYLMRKTRHTVGAIGQCNSGECQVLPQRIYDDVTVGWREMWNMGF